METFLQSHIYVIFIILLLFVLDIGETCNGYKIKVNHVRRCSSTKGRDVIILKNTTATFGSDCYLRPKGCVVITKPYTTGKVTYKMTKPPLPPIEGTGDICSSDENNVMNILHNFGIPSKCPSSSRTSCIRSNKVSMESYRSKLPMIAGTTNLNVNIDHGTAGTTCFDMNLSISRK